LEIVRRPEFQINIKLHVAGTGSSLSPRLKTEAVTVPEHCVLSHLKFLTINKVQKRRILGPKRDEVTGEWRKLHNEELHNLYSSPSIIRIMKSREGGH
jgi:hypothetical protein